MDKYMIYEDSETQIRFSELSQIYDFLLSKKNVFLIIDEIVNNLYFNNFNNVCKHIIQSSESNKSLETFAGCISDLSKLKADKDITVIGIGGGIVCDMAGFVAGIYKRGTNLALIPTTLLAQVDAAIGGKNAVNFDNTKNMIGTFKKPQEILINIDFLKSLYYDEFINGIAEVIKIACVYDVRLFEILENVEPQKLINHKEMNLKIISMSVTNKMEIVKLDFFDSGIRRILNFGHTTGHAIEAAYGLSHGKSVAVGISIAANMSLKYKMISKSEFVRINNLLSKFGFDTAFKYDSEILMNYILQDKKISSGFLNEILLKGIGKYELMKISLENFRSLLNDLH